MAQILVIIQKWPPEALGRKDYFLSKLQSYIFKVNIFLISLWKFLMYMFYYYVLLSNFKMYGQKREVPNWRNVAKCYKLIFITEKVRP